MEMICNTCMGRRQWSTTFFTQCEYGHKYILKKGNWVEVHKFTSLNDLFKEVYADSLKDLISQGSSLFKHIGKKK